MVRIGALVALVLLCFVGDLVCCEVSDVKELPVANRQVTTVLVAIHKRHETVVGLPEERQRKEVHTLCNQLRTDDKSGMKATIGRFRGRKRFLPDEKELNDELFKWALIGKAHVIETLINLGAEKDVQDEGGVTPAMYACKYGNWRALQVLVKRGANLGLTDHYQRKASQYTTFSGLKPEEWYLLSFHETKQVRDPRAKCREIIQARLQKDKRCLDEEQMALEEKRERIHSATSFGKSEVVTYDDQNGKKMKPCLIL